MASTTDLLTAMLNGVNAINSLRATLLAVFPQATAVSTSVTVGTITFTSSQASGFLTVITSSGATFKVPLYGA